MPVFREQQAFPTRQYPYRPIVPVGTAAPDSVTAPPASPLLMRFVQGLDATPQPFTPAELATLDDPLGRLLRSHMAANLPFPLTLRALLAALDGLSGTPAELPQQLVFLVADGGHINWTPATDRLERAFRLVVARGQGDFTLLVSASTVLDSPTNFLQIIGWDATHEVFHYYERRNGTFAWAGMSPHALREPTRGQGPFDSHVNGSLVMKELRAPWIHWHAPQAGINEDALAPTDPLRAEPLFLNRVTAERLETEIVVPGIQRWNAVRVRKALDANGIWQDVPHFLRQAIFDTTVNLASSDTASHLLVEGGTLHPPLSFFLNRETLFNTLELLPDATVDTTITIPAELYLACLSRYDVHRSDGHIRIEGDSHFAFLTPEPAFEDTDLVAQLLQAELLSRRFVACLTMVDFTNPVFSKRRAALLRYVPERVHGPMVSEAFEAAFVARLQTAVAAADHPADSPEREFLDHWQLIDWEGTFIQRIGAYFQALQVAANDPAVVDGWFRLMEYRRRRFRRRPLAEFKLTTPRTNIQATPLAMTPTGQVVPC